MKNLTRVLMIAMVGLVLCWGIVSVWASDPPNKPNKQGPPDVKIDVGGKPPAPPPDGGLADIMQNPKIKEELKRHREVMKGLFEQAKELRKTIIEAVKAKIEELKAQRKAEQEAGKSDNSQAGSSEQGTKENRREAAKDELKKVPESYRPQAEAIAGLMTSEIILHHQNLLNILLSEQANVKKKITERILTLDRPGMMRKPGVRGPERERGEGKRNMPNRSEKQKPVEAGN